MNKVILIGRLTADPELRQTQSGVSSCQFTVAVDRRFADKNTGERQADFIRCQAWRQTAEFVSKYFSKGKMIALEGSLRTGSYTDRNHSDVTHYTTDVFVDAVEFCGGKNDGSGSGNTQNTQSAAPAQQQPQNNPDMSYGSLSDFEEILSDGDVPF
jgi:single-strand DNA-binding protein